MKTETNVIPFLQPIKARVILPARWNAVEVRLENESVHELAERVTQLEERHRQTVLAQTHLEIELLEIERDLATAKRDLRNAS